MNDWILDSQYGSLMSQAGERVGSLQNMWANTAPQDPTTLIYLLGGLATIITLISVGTFQYYRWKKFKVFEDEMRSLDLDTESEGTLALMVKRYAMDEPVQILFSPRLFDEMASNEIVRVLGSPGSMKAKQHFIDTVYKIREKTYFPDLQGEALAISPENIEDSRTNGHVNGEQETMTPQDLANMKPAPTKGNVRPFLRSK